MTAVKMLRHNISTILTLNVDYIPTVPLRITSPPLRTSAITYVPVHYIRASAITYVPAPLHTCEAAIRTPRIAYGGVEARRSTQEHVEAI